MLSVELQLAPEVSESTYVLNSTMLAGVDKETAKTIHEYSNLLDEETVNARKLDEVYRFVIKLRRKVSSNAITESYLSDTIKGKYEIALSLCEKLVKALKAESEPSNQFGKYLNKSSCLLYDLVGTTNKNQSGRYF